MFGVPTGKPGVQTSFIAKPRDIFYGNGEHATYLPMPLTIDGTLSSNPANSPYPWLLWAGMIMGQITATKKFAPSILGVTSGALGGAQTTLSTDAATATELARRVGASGTLNLVGAPAAGGVVRGLPVVYSAVNTTTGAITITATASGAVSNVNQIEALPVVDSTGSGTFTLTIEGITTGAITYSATVATLITNTNAALNAAFGTSAIVSSGASLAAFVLTFSGTGYAARPIVGHATATLLAGATGFTIGGSTGVGAGNAGASTTTTAGVTAVAAQEGEFVGGSLITANDGSQTPKTIICDPFGLKVIDEMNTTRVDVLAPKLWAGGGVINTAYLVNYPADAAGQAYIKNSIRAFISNASFSDDFI